MGRDVWEVWLLLHHVSVHGVWSHHVHVIEPWILWAWDLRHFPLRHGGWLWDLREDIWHVDANVCGLLGRDVLRAGLLGHLYKLFLLCNDEVGSVLRGLWNPLGRPDGLLLGRGVVGDLWWELVLLLGR